MATALNSRVPPMAKPAISSVYPIIKAYAIPLILFSASVFFQLFVNPHFFPVSHYDVLGIKHYSSVEEVTQAYEKLSRKWNSEVEAPPISEFIKVQYAFELLTNQFWKRDYDIYGIDEQHHIIGKIQGQYATSNFSAIDLPLITTTTFELEYNDFDNLNFESLSSKLESDKPLLVQIFSRGSIHCADFSSNWKRIVTLLEGVANTGVVELGDVQLVSYLAEKKSKGKPFFGSGVPELVAFPPGCKSLRCLYRYQGELSVDAVTDWVATTVLNLPRILYYSKDSLVQNFLARSKLYKVKVILFSATGERATPFIRQAAKNYWAYANFGFVLWQKGESSLWWNMFGVESAPAVVFLKETGTQPVVYHGLINSSLFIDMMEKNKQQVLPQLRSATSMELGCDARGFSRAGNDTRIWYCVILAGRQSKELYEMRETMRRIQEILSNDAVSEDPSSAPAAFALKQKRLTFTWLDGESQKRYCFFYINSESSYETCGPRRDIIDVAQLLIVRYEKNTTDDSEKVEKEPLSIFESLHKAEADPASQLVAKYSGPNEIPQMIQWISGIIKDGDSRDLPSFRTKTPDLMPEDGDTPWSKGSEQIFSTGKGLKQRLNALTNQIFDYLGEPWIGPFLLLGALMSFGRIWLRRSQPTHPTESNRSSQSSTSHNVRRNRESQPRNQLIPPSLTEVHSNQRNGSNDQLIPPSVTDSEPKDAYQMEFSDSDAE